MFLYLTLGTHFTQKTRPTSYRKKVIATHNVILKTYANGRLAVVISERVIVQGKRHDEYEIQPGLCDDKPPKEVAPSDVLRAFNRSLARTKQTIYDLAFANQWELFVTVTFDKEKVDRYNYEEIANRFGKLLNNVKQRKAPNLKYLLVPEPHQDGAIHFHGLFSGLDGLNIVKAVNKSTRKPLKDGTGRQIFNVKDLNLGHTTATFLDHSEKACTYVTKYITAENFIGCGIEKGRKRYWSSQALKRPDLERMMMTDKEKADLLSFLAKNKETVSDKTVSVNADGFENTIRYIVLQEYQEMVPKSIVGVSNAI